MELSWKLEEVRFQYKDSPDLEKVIAETIALYCADRGLNPVETLSQEVIQKKLSEHVSDYTGFIDQFVTTYEGKVEYNYQAELSEAQDYYRGMITDTLKTHKQYRENESYCHMVSAQHQYR